MFRVRFLGLWPRNDIRCLLVGVLLLVIFMSPVQAGRVLNDSFVAKPFSHHIWQEVLSEYVTFEGNVDFVTLRAKPKRLNDYLNQIARYSPDSHPDYFPSYHARLAYWLNAHNAIALRLILDAYPVSSIDQIPNYFQNNRYYLGGKSYSLWAIRDRIAHEFFLRPESFFALSIGTYGSPKLDVQAYSVRSDVLDKQIEIAAQEFLSSPDHVLVIEPRPGECAAVELDPLIKQFERPIKRFEAASHGLSITYSPSVLDFVKEYIQPDAHGFLYENCGHPITYMRFDNRLKRF